MKPLITGGAGFVGLAVIRHINNSTEHSIVNVDKLTYASNLDSLESVENNRLIFEQADILNINENKRTLNIID
jgi:dTDP-glucose 4,6-dehydratase